jgi:hypothetical protein
LRLSESSLAIEETEIIEFSYSSTVNDVSDISSLKSVLSAIDNTVFFSISLRLSDIKLKSSGGRNTPEEFSLELSEEMCTIERLFLARAEVLEHVEIEPILLFG